MRPAIVEPAMSQFVAETRDLIEAVSEARSAETKISKGLDAAREAHKARRLELGMYLRTMRDRYPPRGTAENGWRAYLEAIEMSASTAKNYMDEAGDVSNRTASKSAEQLAHSGEDYERSPHEPTDEEAPRRETDVADETGDHGDQPDPLKLDPEIDRNTWCTPPWITDALGQFDLDPCSNDRSTVNAVSTFDLTRGENGLQRAGGIGHDWRVFINPPYGRGQVIQWVQAYAHVRFCFLLKFDPSTVWFGELFERTELILIPRGTRVDFVPPVGVPPDKAEAVQFPHALFYARADDATDAIRALCFSPWRTK